jgi:5-methylcytosine-specific restriction enzyme B
MAIPENLTKEDLIQAADKIIEEGIPRNAHSSTYDVFYNNKFLPPKLVVSYANLFRNGSELDRNTFEGGIDTECFKLLESNGFTIYKKDQIYPILIKFLKQAEVGDLKISEYPKQIKGLACEVSFGQGNQARIPWISLLLPPNKTSDGIYPVYLLYKKIAKLFLAYGISETNPPSLNWNLDGVLTIKEYFKKENLIKPDRYGSSMIYKIYEISNLPSAKELDNDLNQIIEIYKTAISMPPDPDGQKPFSIEQFIGDVYKSGLLYNKKLIFRFISSLYTKPFVILTGLSGSGKTKLAHTFAEWICENKQQYSIIPVGADWSNREPLLGYPNGLENTSYILPESGALQLIIKASQQENQNKPFFLILDEMNLSHVERYFADFLSIMETGKTIKLYDGEPRKGKMDGIGEIEIVKEISWPKNLFIVGTVNIDETTYMFSPKVLDRANVIEFRVSSEGMSEFLRNKNKINLQKLHSEDDCDKPGLGSSMAADFLEQAGRKPYSESASNALESFFPLLQKAGAEFGYRSANEISILVGVLEEITKGEEYWDKDNKNPIFKEDFIDIAIMQKLLPKLHGSRTKLISVLAKLGYLCIADNMKRYVPEKDKDNKNLIKDFLDNDPEELLTTENGLSIQYRISFEKIKRMYKNVLANGFTSYAEA